MRCHYLSDLHLESQDFRWPMPRGDVLIVAGDLCHASALDPARTDLYRTKQRDRVLRFVDAATKSFAQVLMIAGNHEHYDGVFEDTVPLLQQHLAGVTVLDDEAVDLDGVRFFGMTLWTDIAGGDEIAAEAIRRGMGEYFFAKKRGLDDAGGHILSKLRPPDTLAAHQRALDALKRHAIDDPTPMVVISHHAPSLLGLNPEHKGNGLDGAFASDLDGLVTTLPNLPFWIHGHTHIRKRYRIGNTTLLANCRGFDGKDLSSRKFSPDCWFEI